MIVRPTLSILAVGVVCAASLAGCTTPQVKPPLSKAVLQARAAEAAKPAACAPGGLETISPVDLSFPFDDATLSEVGQKRLAAAARWLGCHPDVEAVIKPGSDSQGDAAHQNDLAQRRAKTAADQLRALGANGVVHMLSRNAADPVSAPHLVINATGRGW